MRDIRSEIDPINEIIPFPAIVAEILAALRNVDIATRKICKLIESDAALTTNILRAANAPFYGIRGHVNNAGSAITLIGLEETSRLLLTYHMKGRLIFLNMQQWGSLELLWIHSIATATGSRQFARHFKLKTSEKEFTAGLLHELGKLVLIQYFPDSLSVTDQMVKELAMHDVEAERQTLAISHTEIGAQLGEKWSLPKEYVEVMECRHEADGAVIDPLVNDVVQFTDLLSEQCRYGIGEQPAGFSINDDPCWNVLTSLDTRFLERTPFEVSQELLPEFESNKELLHLFI
jgi:putative nucleotidyltransferase with HDIG domain